MIVLAPVFAGTAPSPVFAGTAPSPVFAGTAPSFLPARSFLLFPRTSPSTPSTST